MAFAATWMDLEIVMLRELRAAQQKASGETIPSGKQEGVRGPEDQRRIPQSC